MRADRDRLADVLEAIERIERHTSAGREVFNADELVQVWVVRHLQIIGEAVGHLDKLKLMVRSAMTDLAMQNDQPG